MQPGKQGGCARAAQPGTRFPRHLDEEEDIWRFFLGFIRASRRQSGIRGRADYLAQAEQRPHAPQNHTGMG